uniref:Coagulation factor VII n=1 Tax=Piliocolobus tephrosceles TaxID=591936 RepID=A0A8C9IQF4_9PRIM
MVSQALGLLCLLLGLQDCLAAGSPWRAAQAPARQLVPGGAAAGLPGEGVQGGAVLLRGGPGDLQGPGEDEVLSGFIDPADHPRADLSLSPSRGQANSVAQGPGKHQRSLRAQRSLPRRQGKGYPFSGKSSSSLTTQDHILTPNELSGTAATFFSK